jgi:hypothetical protein
MTPGARAIEYGANRHTALSEFAGRRHTARHALLRCLQAKHRGRTPCGRDAGAAGWMAIRQMDGTMFAWRTLRGRNTVEPLPDRGAGHGAGDPICSLAGPRSRPPNDQAP